MRLSILLYFPLHNWGGCVTIPPIIKGVFMRRVSAGVWGWGAKVLFCKNCGAAFPVLRSAGRLPVYCSNSCKQAFYRFRRAGRGLGCADVTKNK